MSEGASIRRTLDRLAGTLDKLQRAPSVGNLGSHRFPTGPGLCASGASHVQIKLEIERKGHKLISQSVAFRGSLPSTVESGSFPFRYQTAGAECRGGRTQEASDVSAEIARPFAELRWTAPCRERPGRKRRWRNQRISLTSGRESPGGEALTAVYLSHRVSAGPMTARTRSPTGVLGEGFDFLRWHPPSSSAPSAWALALLCPSGLGWRAPYLPRRLRRPCGTASPVRERRQLEDQHRQRFLRWPAVRCRHLEGVRRENVRQPGHTWQPRPSRSRSLVGC